MNQESAKHIRGWLLGHSELFVGVRHIDVYLSYKKALDCICIFVKNDIVEYREPGPNKNNSHLDFFDVLVSFLEDFPDNLGLSTQTYQGTAHSDNVQYYRVDLRRPITSQQWNNFWDSQILQVQVSDLPKAVLGGNPQGPKGILGSNPGPVGPKGVSMP
jgi:hypothetical protein